MSWVSKLKSNTSIKASGKCQMISTTHDLAGGAGTTTLFTGSIESVVLESLVVRLPDVDMSDDAGAFTGFYIQLSGTTNIEIISAADGAKANCTAEAQMSWTGAILVPSGELVQVVITGGAGDATTEADIVAKFRAVEDNGTLI